MNRNIIIVTSGTLLFVLNAGLAPVQASTPSDTPLRLASLSGPASENNWKVLPREQELTGIRLTQYQETFVPLDFDPANPDLRKPRQPSRPPIWPAQLIKKPKPAAKAAPAAVPAVIRPPVPNYYAPAAARPGQAYAPAAAFPPMPGQPAAARQPVPNYFAPAAPQPRPAYNPPVAFPPMPGQPGRPALPPQYGAGRYPQPGQAKTRVAPARAYAPGAYNPWSMMPPPPPPPKTDWGNNPFGPQVIPRTSSGNSWGFSARSGSSAYAPPAWSGQNYAPADPIGQDAKKNTAQPAYPYAGRRPPAYGWPRYAPYPGYR